MNKDNCATVLALEGILKNFLILLPFKIKHNKAVQLVIIFHDCENIKVRRNFDNT